MKNILLISILLITTFGGCASSELVYDTTTVTFDSSVTPLTVRLADTQAKEELGLGDTESLGPNEGMAFPFVPAKNQQFWMKGMVFPIDMIWVANDVVIGVSANAQPEAPTTRERNYKLYGVNQPVDWVIETPAGWAATHNVRMGTKVVITP